MGFRFTRSYRPSSRARPLSTVIAAVLLAAASAGAPRGEAAAGPPDAARSHIDPVARSTGGPAMATARRDGVPSDGTFVPEWSWPLAPAPKILQVFEKPPQPWQRGHRGVDLAVTEPVGTRTPGAAISSPADGVVSFVGTVVDRSVLSIDHGDGHISSFEPVTSDLVKGQRILEGEILGTLSVTAAVTGPWHCASPCVHWGVRVDGEYVDPLGFVMDRRPSVLLPLEG